MPIYQANQLNLSGALAPGLYVAVVAPPPVVRGVPTNGLGLVGVASWGPKNAPFVVGSPQMAAISLGAIAARSRDLATACAIAMQMGQYNNTCVRVTDGTDTAASIALKDAATVTGLTLTGVYTGVLGNTISATVAAGTKPSTFKLTVTLPGGFSEVFDNLANWAEMLSAVNNGQSDIRGASQLVVATIGTSNAAPALNTYTLTGGTDGATGVTDATMLGADGSPATGMYALQGTGVLTAVLVDHSTSTNWSAMALFGQQQGMFIVGAGSVGQSIPTVATALSTAGVDNYSFKALSGDWVYWWDAQNRQRRLVSPSIVWAALRAMLNPNQSTLNKPVNGFLGTQRSEQSVQYSQPEKLAASQGRLDYLANPSPGGNYFSFQTDKNSSSYAATDSEAYTAMTNFLSLTMAANFGWVIGNPQTEDLRDDVNDSITAFLSSLWKQKYIGDVNNPTAVPFSVQTDSGNNPDNMVSLGVMQTLVKVKYLSIVRVFAISLQGGSTVQVTVSNG